MYIAKVIITIDPRRAESLSTRRMLQARLRELSTLLGPFRLSVKSSEFYEYYENEEAEMRGIPNLALACHLQAACRKFRSVPLLCQIAQSVAALFDGSFGVSYRCTVLDPEVVPDDVSSDESSS